MDLTDIIAAYKHRDSELTIWSDYLRSEIIRTSKDGTMTAEKRKDHIDAISCKLISVIKANEATFLSEIASPLYETREFSFTSIGNAHK